MFGKFVGTWVDQGGFHASITGDNGTVQVKFTDVVSGPFLGQELEGAIRVQFSNTGEPIRGVLQPSGQTIIWDNGTVWTKQESPLPQLSLPVSEPLRPSCTGVGVSLDVETVEPKTIDGQFVYSAKFLCGRIPHSLLDPQEPPLEFPLVPGTYRTAINVNNPNLSEVAFTKMALTTNPEGQPRGKAGTPLSVSLGPNEGFEIDCQDIEGLLTLGGTGVDLFNNSNIDTVFNSPPNLTVFPLNAPAVIRQLVTYHFNNGQGDPPGAISLRNNQSGAVFGPFAAQGVPGQGGVPNANWVANLNQLVPAGNYTVIDEKPQTWSYNQQSLLAGFAIVRGSYSFVGRAPFFKGFVVIRSTKQLDVVAVYTVKNVISSVPNPPVIVGTTDVGGGVPAGPSVRYGSLNLTPTVRVVPKNPGIVAETLVVSAPPASLELFGGPVLGSVFEIVVVTDPPARNTHLGVNVTGVLEDPSPIGGFSGSGPADFWQRAFNSLFIVPLQDNQTDANGVLKVDVTAQNVLSAIINAPPGYPSGRMLITINLSDGPHKLDLTLTTR